MNRVMLSASLGIVLVVGLLGQYACLTPEARELQYQEAKTEAELKINEFVDWADQINSMDEDALSSEDPATRKLVAGLANQMYEVSMAVQKVKQLVPPGYEADYTQWAQEMLQKIEATYK